MTTEAFTNEIQHMIDEARNKGEEYVVIRAGDVHRVVGGYKNNNHRMPSCCGAMYKLKKANDEVLNAPPSGLGANLIIKYYL